MLGELYMSEHTRGTGTIRLLILLIVAGLTGMATCTADELGDSDSILALRARTVELETDDCERVIAVDLSERDDVDDKFLHLLSPLIRTTLRHRLTRMHGRFWGYLTNPLSPCSVMVIRLPVEENRCFRKR